MRTQIGQASVYRRLNPLIGSREVREGACIIQLSRFWGYAQSNETDRQMKSFFELNPFNNEVPFLLENLELEYSRGRSHVGEMTPALTIESLRAGWLHPAEIAEFADIAARVPLDHVRVIRAAGFPGDCGYSYLPDEYGALRGIQLITLDDSMLPEDLSLHEIFLHELAHSRSGPAAHDWQFVVHLNLLRLEAGLGPTMDEYDCRDAAMLYGIPAKEILTLAAQTALALRAQYDLKTARTLMLISPYEDLFAGERQIHQGEGRFKLDSRGQVLSRTDRAF